MLQSDGHCQHKCKANNALGCHAACATGVKVSPLLTAPQAPTLSSAWHLMENQEPPAVTPHKPDKLRD